MSISHAFFSSVCNTNVNRLHANTNSTHIATCSFHSKSIRYFRPTRVCFYGFENKKNCHFIFPTEIELIITVKHDRHTRVHSTRLLFNGIML